MPALLRPAHRTGLLALILMLLAPVGQARQLGFQRQGSQLTYRWQLPDGQLRPLRLQLPESSAVPALIPWRQTQADDHVYQALLHDARSRYPDVRFRLRRDTQPWQLEFSASTQEQLEAIREWLQRQQQRQLDEYLHQHYFTLAADDNGQSWIQIDYSRLIRTLSPEMMALAKAIADLPGEARPPTATDPVAMRHSLALLLDFVQSIPYQALESTGDQPGLGFLLPRELLRRNAGDCDSKVVLLATLLRSLYPQLPLSLLLIPEHALLGVGLPARSGEASLRTTEDQLLLLEPAGPANLPPGQIGEASRRQLAAGQYRLEAVPTGRR